ncbi:hypothetical protein ACFQH2_15660 [Natronoarchaeum sp. GCM10025703]|uniref:hypothetical protein n=1 Tax=unclassified Natronoarchaeum TaxID=2620183 RepID=UPI003619951A
MGFEALEVASSECGYQAVGSVGTTPKDGFRLDGLLKDEGEVDGEHHTHIGDEDSGRWTIEVVEHL